MPDSDFDRAEHEQVNIAIICMIPKVELRAIKYVLKNRGAKQIELPTFDGEEYYEILNKNDQKLRIVVACCQGQSNIESAITTHTILFRHNPRYAFLCGIGGGMNLEKYKLGDVVVAPEVIYRRFTKVQNDTDGVTRWFRPEILNVPASTGGRFLAQQFFSLHPNPGKIQAVYNDGDLFSAHDEKILSWDLVLDHGPTKQELLRYVDGQFAVVEMEGAGFLKAVASHAKNGFSRPWRPIPTGGVGALIVRGISDAAEHKAGTDSGDKDWRRYAARNAVHVVLLLVDLLTETDFAAPTL